MKVSQFVITVVEQVISNRIVINGPLADLNKNQPHRERYEGYSHSGHNQPQRRDELPSLNARGPRLAVLDEKNDDDEFIAHLEHERTVIHQTKPQNGSETELPILDI